MVYFQVICGAHFVNGEPSKNQFDVDYLPTVFKNLQQSINARNLSKTLTTALGPRPKNVVIPDKHKQTEQKSNHVNKDGDKLVTGTGQMTPEGGQIISVPSSIVPTHINVNGKEVKLPQHPISKMMLNRKKPPQLPPKVAKTLKPEAVKSINLKLKRMKEQGLLPKKGKTKLIFLKPVKNPDTIAKALKSKQI